MDVVSSQTTQSTPKPDLFPRLRDCCHPDFLTSEKIPPFTPLLRQESKNSSSLFPLSYLLGLPAPLALSIPWPYHFIPIPFSPSFFDCQSSACITFYIKSEIPLTNSLSLISLPIIHFLQMFPKWQWPLKAKKDHVALLLQILQRLSSTVYRTQSKIFKMT